MERIQTEHWSDGKIIYYLRNLISDFKIGHMGLSCCDEYRADSVVYPIVGEWFGEDFYIIAALPTYESYLGYRLTKIEGIPLKRVLEMYDERVSNETYSYLKNCFEQYNDQGFIKSDLEYSGIKDNEKENATFTLEKDGRTQEVEVMPITLDSDNAVDYSSVYSNMENLPISMETYYESEEAPFTYVIDEENRAVYFQYNQCMDASTEGAESGYPDFQEFFSKMIEDMKDNSEKYDYLVVNLRKNQGGSEALLNEAIQKYGEFLNTQKIRVLIGKQTYSAGVDAIDSLLFAFDDVTLYGEETGLAVHNYTGRISNVLPNTGNVLYTTDHEDFSHIIDRRAEDPSKGVLPDVEVQMKFEDYEKGIDDVYMSAVR